MGLGTWNKIIALQAGKALVLAVQSNQPDYLQQYQAARAEAQTVGGHLAALKQAFTDLQKRHLAEIGPLEQRLAEAEAAARSAKPDQRRQLDWIHERTVVLKERQSQLRNELRRLEALIESINERATQDGKPTVAVQRRGIVANKARFEKELATIEAELAALKLQQAEADAAIIRML